MPPLPRSSSPINPTADKVAFKDSIWRPIVCCGGALGLGLLLAPVILRPAPQSSTDNVPEILIPGSSTVVLHPSAPPGVLLRGQLRLVADMMGTAPVNGEVARQLVPAGTLVKKGDPVVQISSGAETRAPLAAETTQTAAEKAQITAADTQTALSQKIVVAQSGLRAAQERVDAAQKQVGAARDLVRRLQNGESVSASELPTSFRSASSPSDNFDSEPRRPAKKRRQSHANEAALQAAQTAHDAARDGAKALATARAKLADAEKGVQDADEKMKTATKAVVDTEARFDDKKASAADVEAARANQKDAQAGVTAALKTLTTAQSDSTKREKEAAQLQSDADKAQATAATALKDTHLFDETPAPTPTTQSTEPSGHITLTQAAQFAASALDESRRAARDAEKMRVEIDDYQRQVNKSSSATETANKNLEDAQKTVFASVPRAKFIPALAPDDGVVTWVARLAREVGVGESVFGLSRGTKVNASFEDKKGLWKHLKKGMALTAFVTPPSAALPTTSSTPTGLSSVATPVPLSLAENRVVVTVKVTDVKEPNTEGQTATISGDVSVGTTGSDPSSEAPFQAGDTVMASVADPTAKPILSVPTSALVDRDGFHYVAVLKPAPVEPSANADEALTAPKDQPIAKRFMLTWQPVKTGRTDGLRQEIVSGISSGMRIVAVTTQLEDLNLLPKSKEALKEAVAGTTPSPQRQENAPLSFLIRLTAS